MRAGESTSTGMTWLISPHLTRMTAQPMPPALRQRSSRRRMSSPTSGSLSVTYVRGTMCVALIANLCGANVTSVAARMQNAGERGRTSGARQGPTGGS